MEISISITSPILPLLYVVIPELFSRPTKNHISLSCRMKAILLTAAGGALVSSGIAG